MSVANPFKGLAPYDASDTLFEREADVELLKSRIWSGRYTILFAGSGVGKTSFLRAKVVGALRETLGASSVTMPEGWTEADPLGMLRDFRQNAESHRADVGTRVLILDQFEELFQSFPNLSLLNALGNELAGFAQSDQLADTRILISTREEFLAELSTFEDFLPGLFTNYYRLERPIVSQARSIIVRTADSVKVAVSPHLSELLNDLTVINRDRADPDLSLQGRLLKMWSGLGVSTWRASRASVLRDKPARANAATKYANVIDPPFLQIVCHTMWEREQPDAARPFLSTYSKGEARQVLEDYTNQRLTVLPRRQRVLLSQAVGHLTGPHESKRYMPLGEIAQAIKTHDVLSLRTGLDSLCASKVRILKVKNHIYGLYHDMYAPMLWLWREREIHKQQRRRLTLSILLLVAVCFFLAYPLLKWWGVKEALRNPVYGNRHDYSTVLSMRNTLSYTVVWRWLGDLLWSRYNEQLATLAALRMDTDGAVLYKLSGLSTAGKATHSDIEALLAPISYLQTTLEARDPDVFADVALASSGNEIVEGTAAGSFVRLPLNRDDQRREVVIETSLQPSASDSEAPPQIKLLCIAPGGETGIVASVSEAPVTSSKQPDDGSPVILVHLASYATRSGQALGSADLNVRVLPILRAAAGKVNLAAVNSGSNAGVITVGPNALTTLQTLKASFSSDGRELAILAADYVYVFAFEPTTSKFGTVQVLDAQGVRIIGFNKTDEVLGVAGGPEEAAHVQFFIRSATGKYFKSRVCTNCELPYPGRFVFRRDGKVLLKWNSAWMWITPGAPAPPESNAWSTGLNAYTPQAFDEKSGSLLFEDNLGRLRIVPISDRSGQGTMLSETEPTRGYLSPQQRVFSTGSLSQFEISRRFVSLENNGSIARLWEVPLTPFVARDVSVTPVGERAVATTGAPCLVSGDGFVCKYFGQSGRLQTTVVGDVKNRELSVVQGVVSWRAKGLLPHGPPQAVEIAADGTRALLWYKDELVYSANDEPQVFCYTGTKPFLRSVIGPGANVTFLTARGVEVHAPAKTWRSCTQKASKETNVEYNPVWEAETGGVITNLAETVDNGGAVIVYSARWAHYITSSGGDKPIIRSVFLTSPATPEGWMQTGAGKNVKSSELMELTPELLREVLPSRRTARALLESPATLVMCEDGEGRRIQTTGSDGSGSIDWRNIMCQVEYRTHRRTGLPSSNE